MSRCGYGLQVHLGLVLESVLESGAQGSDRNENMVCCRHAYAKIVWNPYKLDVKGLINGSAKEKKFWGKSSSGSSEIEP